MMVGVVQSDLEAVISIAVIEPSGRHQVVEAVIDTGYNGFLTLAYGMIELLAPLDRLAPSDFGRWQLTDLRCI